VFVLEEASSDRVVVVGGVGKVPILPPRPIVLRVRGRGADLSVEMGCLVVVAVNEVNVRKVVIVIVQSDCTDVVL